RLPRYLVEAVHVEEHPRLLDRALGSVYRNGPRIRVHLDAIALPSWLVERFEVLGAPHPDHEVLRDHLLYRSSEQRALFHHLVENLLDEGVTENELPRVRIRSEQSHQFSTRR